MSSSSELARMMSGMSTFQRLAATTAVYPDSGKSGGALYTCLGMAAEAGEALEKLKKIIRRRGVGFEFSDEERVALAGEAGDVLWYVSQFVGELGLDLGTVAAANIDKLRSRARRGLIDGDGDNR